MRYGPHGYAFGQPIANLDRFCGRDEAVDKFWIDALVHDESRRRDADLAGVAKLGRRQDPLPMWAKKLIEKKPFKLVAVALANKMARIAFAILRGKTSYREIPA